MAEDSGGCEDTFEFRSDSESCVGSLLGGEDVYDSDWLVEEDGSRGRSPSPGFGSDADDDDDGYASDATVRPQSFKTVRRDVAEDSVADSELDDIPKMGLRLGLRSHRTTHQDYCASLSGVRCLSWLMGASITATQSWIAYQLNEGILLISQRFRLWSRIAPKYIWEMVSSPPLLRVGVAETGRHSLPKGSLTSWRASSLSPGTRASSATGSRGSTRR